MRQRCLGVTALVCVLGAAVLARAQEAGAQDAAAQLAAAKTQAAAGLADLKNPDFNQLWGARNTLAKLFAELNAQHGAGKLDDPGTKLFVEVGYQLAKVDLFLAPAASRDMAKGLLVPECIKAAETCVGLDPKHPEGWLLLAKIHMHPFWGRDLGKAAQALQRDLQVNPQREESFKWLAFCLLNMQQAQQAAGVAGQGIQLHPKSAKLHELQGDAHYQLKQYAQAKAAYDQAANLDPTAYAIIDKWINADLLAQQAAGQPPMPNNALQWLAKFDQAHPEQWKAGEKRAEIFLLQMWPGVFKAQGAAAARKHGDQGILQLWNLEKRFPGIPEYAYWAKLECPVYRSYQLYDKLADAVVRAIQANPADTSVMSELMNAAGTMNLFDEYRSTRQWQRGITLVNQLLKVMPADTEPQRARRGVLHQVLKECYQPLGKIAEAEKAIVAAIADDPRNAVYPNAYGLMLRYEGRMDEAEQAFRTSLEIQPDHPWAATNLATLLMSTGQWAKFNEHMAATLEFSRQAVETATGARAQLNDDPAATAGQRAAAKEAEESIRFHAANLRRLYIEGLRLQRAEGYTTAAKEK